MGARVRGGWWRSIRRRADVVVDLREDPQPPGASLAQRDLPEVDVAALRARLVRTRAEMVRAEAQRELDDLRRRHWSAERLFEEGRLGIDWWEHPSADPHAVLGLVPGVSLDEATRARRSLARAVHPDAGNDSVGEALPQMAAVNVAYDRVHRALSPVPESRPGADDRGGPERGRHHGGIALGRGCPEG